MDIWTIKNNIYNIHEYVEIFNNKINFMIYIQTQHLIIIRFEFQTKYKIS